MMQEVGLAPEMKVREHIELVASYYPAAMSPGSRRWGLRMSTRWRSVRTASSRADRSGSSSLRSRFAAARSCCFWTSPPSDWTSRRAACLWATVRQLRSSGTAIVLTTHYLEEAEALADRVAVLARGRLVASGTVSEIRSVVESQADHLLDRIGARRYPELAGCGLCHPR